MDDKRLLILSINPVSDSSSNGRTIGLLVSGIKAKNVAQFYISSDSPDNSRCLNYFHVSDIDALDSIFKYKFKKKKQIRNQQINSLKKVNYQIKLHTPFKRIIRDIIWCTDKWKSEKYYKFIEEFKPDLLLIVSGDCPFLHNEAVKLKKKYGIPLIVYNSEGYYFKRKNYMGGGLFSCIIYKEFRKRLVKSYQELMEYSDYTIYLNSMLKEEYDKVFDGHSSIIYTPTDISIINDIDKKNRNIKVISYSGNINLDRHKSLIEVAQALEKINKDIVLDIYGKVPNRRVLADISRCKNIRFHGFINYEKVKKIMQQSDVVVHVEAFTAFRRKDSLYSFSTKIADSLGCGACFFVYTPKEIAVTKYLEKYSCAVIASDRHELEQKLRIALYDNEVRNNCIKNAMDVVKINHNIKCNFDEFLRIIEFVCGNSLRSNRLN